MNANTAKILGIDPERFHRERLAHLNERFERAHGDDGREMIQNLIDQENDRYNQLLAAPKQSGGGTKTQTQTK